MFSTTSSVFQPRRTVVLRASSSRSRRQIIRMVNLEQVQVARKELKKLMAETHCNPIVIRLGWHDSGTYSVAEQAPWPKPGGATGSIRFKPEIDHCCNVGLVNALNLVAPIKEKCPELSYADLFQLASAVAIMEAGGPFIPLRLGRVDAASPEDCTPPGRLPDAAAPFGDGAKTPAQHLRNIFGRMGLNDKDIVALSGAHTLGRSRPDRSGYGKPVTKYTKDGPGNPGGSSWTVDWLKFDNSYYRDIKDPKDDDLLVLPTDAALFEDEGFRQYAEKYAEDQDAFFADYVESHLKLSELGVKWDGEPVTLQPETELVDAK